jgi:hypothetical protein
MLKILIIPIFLAFHPIHVTLTTIDQAQGTDSMKVFFRMYYDDFLNDYSSYDPKTDLKKISNDDTFPAELAFKYFNEKVQIYVNNKRISGQIVGIKVLDNELFLNMVYRSYRDPKKIRIRNRVLTELYEDQINMIFLNINKHETALRLTPDNDKETWEF